MTDREPERCLCGHLRRLHGDDWECCELRSDTRFCDCQRFVAAPASRQPAHGEGAR